MIGTGDKEPLSPANKSILGNFNLSAQLPNGRSIQVAGYIFEGESVESLNERLDNLQECIERQRLRCEIPELEGKREQMIQALKNSQEVMADLETRRSKGEDLSSQDRLNLRNLRTQVKHISEEIQKGATAIADAKKRAGVGA